MEARHEIIRFDQASPIRLFMHKLGDVTRHWHESLELLFVLTGEVTVLTGDKQTTLQPDDILLINDNVIHELHSEGCVLIAVQIKLSKFDIPQTVLEELHFDCNSTSQPVPERFDALKRIITSMLQFDTGANDTTVFRGRALAYNLLGELVENFKAEKPVAEMNTHKHLERMSNILRYIGEHYHEQLTLGQLAEQEHLSTPYLSSFFEKHMGVNFTTYYTNLRLERAMHDLLYTDITVEQLAVKHGFSDPRAYVRAFKKRYHMLPSQYRKTAGAPEAFADSDPMMTINYLDFKPENYFHVLSRYLPQNGALPAAVNAEENIEALPPITVDAAGHGEALHHHWRSFIGVARAKDLLYGDVQEMLRQLQSDVGFRYLRFHGILSDDMLVCQRGKSGQLQFNFSLVDKALDFVLSVGLKPLIQFSFMPSALAEEPDHTVFANPVVVSMPRKMEEWELLVGEFLHHIRSRYGQKEIRSWLYSVWNEPDTSPTMFGFPHREDFYHLYRHTWDVVKAFDEELIFGTPSLFPATEDGYRWFSEYLHFSRVNNCQPQFLDVHYYADDFQNLAPQAASFTSPAKFNRDPDHFSKFIDRLQQFTKEAQIDHLSLYITEWNLTVSHRNLINDTCFKATHLAKNFLENYDRVNAIGYWALTDFLDELFPEEDLFHGGMGLFTANGIKKPAYHAMSMMAKLGDEVISRGEGYFVTRKATGELTAILYNYEHCNSLLVEEGLGLTTTSRESVFPNSRALEVSLMLENLPEGSYRIRDTILNRNHGSCFDAWVEMGGEALSSTDAAWLQQHCAPALHLSTEETQQGQLYYTATLAPHEVRLVEIKAANNGYC